jgi:hypothetical protein
MYKTQSRNTFQAFYWVIFVLQYIYWKRLKRGNAVHSIGELLLSPVWAHCDWYILFQLVGTCKMMNKYGFLTEAAIKNVVDTGWEQISVSQLRKSYSDFHTIPFKIVLKLPPRAKFTKWCTWRNIEYKLGQPAVSVEQKTYVIFKGRHWQKEKLQSNHKIKPSFGTIDKCVN